MSASTKAVIRIVLLVLLSYALLYCVVARTHMIEKIMAPSVAGQAIVLVLLFIVARILAYLVVPALVLATAAHLAVKYLLREQPDLPAQKDLPPSETGVN